MRAVEDPVLSGLRDSNSRPSGSKPSGRLLRSEQRCLLILAVSTLCVKIYENRHDDVLGVFRRDSVLRGNGTRVGDILGLQLGSVPSSPLGAVRYIVRDGGRGNGKIVVEQVNRAAA